MKTTFKIKKQLFDLENFLQKTIEGVCFVVNVKDDEKENFIKNTWNGIYLIDNKNKLNLSNITEENPILNEVGWG